MDISRRSFLKYIGVTGVTIAAASLPFSSVIAEDITCLEDEKETDDIQEALQEDTFEWHMNEETELFHNSNFSSNMYDALTKGIT